jgi:hypothetical protein
MILVAHRDDAAIRTLFDVDDWLPPDCEGGKRCGDHSAHGQLELQSSHCRGSDVHCPPNLHGQHFYFSCSPPVADLQSACENAQNWLYNS